MSIIGAPLRAGWPVTVMLSPGFRIDWCHLTAPPMRASRFGLVSSPPHCTSLPSSLLTVR